MRGVAVLCMFLCLAVALQPCHGMFVGNVLAFGPAALNYSTNGSRVYSYFPQNTDGNKVVGVDVSPYGTVKQVTPATFLYFSLAQSPGISQLMFIIKPCAQLAPHHHPRADELLMLIQGGPVHVGMVDEAAAGQQSFFLEMNELDITMVPIGDVHYIENLQCQDAVVIGSFSHSDPGIELALGSLLKLADPQLATALSMSQNATAAFRQSTKVAKFQPVQDGGACLRACNITQ